MTLFLLSPHQRTQRLHESRKSRESRNFKSCKSRSISSLKVANLQEKAPQLAKSRRAKSCKVVKVVNPSYFAKSAKVANKVRYFRNHRFCHQPFEQSLPIPYKDNFCNSRKEFLPKQS